MAPLIWNGTSQGSMRRLDGDTGRPTSSRMSASLLIVLATLALVPSPRLRAQTPAQPSRIAPPAQQLLDKTVQALGGENFLKFKSLYTRGRAFVFSEGETAGMLPFESTVVYPDKRRFSYGKWPPVILINDGDDGWEVDRYGVVRQRLEQVRRWKLANRYTLENLLRKVIHEPGLLVQTAGADFVDAAPALVLSLVDSSEARIRLYIHQTTFLPLRIEYQVQDSKTHEWQKYTDSYGDYRNIQDIQTPMHIAHLLEDERLSEIYRTTAAYDKPVPPGFFQPGNPHGVS